MKLEEAVVYHLATSGHGMKTEQIAREISLVPLRTLGRAGVVPFAGRTSQSFVIEDLRALSDPNQRALCVCSVSTPFRPGKRQYQGNPEQGRNSLHSWRGPR